MLSYASLEQGDANFEAFAGRFDLFSKAKLIQTRIYRLNREKHLLFSFFKQLIFHPLNASRAKVCLTEGQLHA